MPFRSAVEIDGLRSTSPNWIRVNDLANVLEQEPNEDTQPHRNGSSDTSRLHGVLQTKGDRDSSYSKQKRISKSRFKVHAQIADSDRKLTRYYRFGKLVVVRWLETDDTGGPEPICL